MSQKIFFTISDFAKLSGVTRQTLIYYDRIGLFSPDHVAENGYRMYSRHQLDVIGIITILADLGVELKQIKSILKSISPDTMEEVLEYQLSNIKGRIKKLTALEDMLELRLGQIRTGKSVVGNTPAFHITQLDVDVPFFVGKTINSAHSDINDEMVLEFFESIEKRHIPLVFTFGYIKELSCISQGEFDKAKCLCFRVKNPEYANNVMKKGKYLVGYGHGYYGKSSELYKDLIDYAERNNLSLIGDAYEEYLIDELAQTDANSYIFQVSIQVEQQKKSRLL